MRGKIYFLDLAGRSLAVPQPQNCAVLPHNIRSIHICPGTRNFLLRNLCAEIRLQCISANGNAGKSDLDGSRWIRGCLPHTRLSCIRHFWTRSHFAMFNATSSQRRITLQINGAVFKDATIPDLIEGIVFGVSDVCASCLVWRIKPRATRLNFSAYSHNGATLIRCLTPVPKSIPHKIR